MKKLAYLSSGIIIGALLVTSGSALAAQVKSLIGQKVTGEYTVVVDGKSLEDKGAVINNKANVPVRAVADALGANISIEGRTINITTTPSTHPTEGANDSATSPNSVYAGRTKEQLTETLNILKTKILAPNQEERANLAKEIERLKSEGATDILPQREAQLSEYDKAITKALADIAEVESALNALN